MSRLAQRYAKSVFLVAEEQNAADAVDADLGRLASAMNVDEVAAAIQSPDTTHDVREQIVMKVLGDAHDVTKNLVRVVLERHREAILGELAAVYKALLHAARGKIVGVVETAKSIDEAGLAAIEAHASKLVGKNVTLEVEVNEDLIGGIRLRIGNTLYDSSVATALVDLERSLLEAAQ